MSREPLAELVAHLQRIGFTQYEARVYVTLVRSGALNGNEISLASDVPSSKTYETLRKLVNKGAVAVFAEDEGTKYVAVAPTKVIERYREGMNLTLDHLEVELGQLTAFEAEEQVLSLRGELSALARVREAIHTAQRELYLSVWSEELPGLRKALLDANARRVHMHIMLYGQVADLELPHLYHHSHAEIVRERIGGRLMVLVADGAQTVVARYAAGSQVYGFSSHNRALALIAQEYLGHDIILECAKDRIDRKDWDAWWWGREDLIEIIMGEGRELSQHEETISGRT